MERLLKKLSNFIYLHYKAVVLLFSFLTILSIAFTVHMKIDSDILDVLPRSGKAVTQFRESMGKFGLMDRLVIVVKSDDGAIEDHIDFIEDLGERLEETALMEYVDYSPLRNPQIYGHVIRHFPLFLDDKGLKELGERLTPGGIESRVRMNRMRLVSPLSSPADSELAAGDPLMIGELVRDSMKRLHKDEPLDLDSGYYFTKDHSSALIFAKPKGRSRDMAYVRELKEKVDAAILAAMKGRNGQGIKAVPVGAHIIAEEVRQVISRDILSSSVLSVVLILLLIWIVYRVRPAVLAAVGYTMLSSLSVTLAFAYIMFGGLNIVTSVVTAVLVGLYVDYSLHMMKRYGDELRTGGDRRRALEITLTKAGPAFIISGLTTSLSFFSIVITKFEGLYELGIVSGIGVLFCLVVNLFLMSSLLLWMSEGQKVILSDEGSSYTVEKLIGFVKKKPGLIVALFALLCVLLGFGLMRLSFDNDPEHIGTGSSPSASVYKDVNRMTGRAGDPLHLIVKGRDDEGLTAAYDQMEKLMGRMKKDGLVSGYDSLGKVFPPPHVQEEKIRSMNKIAGGEGMKAAELVRSLTGSLDRNGLLYEKEHIGKYIDGIIDALKQNEVIGPAGLSSASGRVVGQFYSGKDASLSAYLYPPAGRWGGRDIDMIRAAVKAAGPGWIVTGGPVLFGEIRSSIIKGSILATAATLLLNIVVIRLYFRKLRYIVLVMMPVTLGSLMTAGLMGVLNIPFNFISVGTIALIFGLGVDYGIYLMQAYLREDKRDTGNALRISGKNIMMCAATTFAGCGSLVTAKFAGIAGLGLVLTLGAFFCCLTALLMLPAVLSLLEGRQDSAGSEKERGIAQ